MTEQQPAQPQQGYQPHIVQPDQAAPYEGQVVRYQGPAGAPYQGPEGAPYQGQQGAPHQQGQQGMPYQGQQMPPYQGHVVPYQGPQMVAPKSPILHGLASFFMAGLGTMLAGRPVRGLLIMGMALVNWLLFFIPFIGLFFIITGLGITAFSVVHGYLSAVKWNAQHGVIS